MMFDVSRVLFYPQKGPSFQFAPISAHQTSDLPSKCICEGIFQSPNYAEFRWTEFILKFLKMRVPEFDEFVLK